MKKSLILGFFDGVHLAHQAVIRTGVEFAEESILITLKNFHKNSDFILSRTNSIEKIKSLGVKEIVELDFSKISAMSAQDFLLMLVNNYSPVSISTGFNYTFGLNKSGNAKFLEENQIKYGYKYFCIPPMKHNNQVISSSFIKQLLQEGKLEDAVELLGSSFILEGEVIHGAELGRKIGFPTANINYPKEIVKIPFGVYAAQVNGMSAVLNWGMKPTVHNTELPVVETHILNYSGNLYGKTLKIELFKRIRGEKCFNNLEELKKQIDKDIQACSKL